MATYLHNIIPSKTKHLQTPTTLLFHKRPTYAHLRTFGCLCYPLIPSTSIHKLQKRSTPCVFLGYPIHHRGYKCYDLSTHKVIISRHVVIDEHTFPFVSTPNLQPSYDFLHSNLSSPINPFFWNSISDLPTSTSTPPQTSAPNSPNPPTHEVPPQPDTNHDPPTRDPPTNPKLAPPHATKTPHINPTPTQLPLQPVPFITLVVLKIHQTSLHDLHTQ